MANLKWKYVSPLKDKTKIEVIERQYRFNLPDDLKSCIINNNAGVPSLSAFDLGEKKEMVLGGLLSFNEGDVDSFFDYIELFKKTDDEGLRMFPFALDPAGNFFCIKNNQVVFYNHEDENTIVIADTFSKFLNMLY